MRASLLLSAASALLLAANAHAAALLNFHPLEPRYVQGLQAPTGYNYSWAVDNNRLALDTPGLNSYLNRTTIDKTATTTTQAFVNACTQYCEKTKACAMAHVIMFANFTEGNVICAVYNATSPKTDAFYTKGLWNGPGTVRASYTFFRKAGQVGNLVTSSSSISTSALGPVSTSSAQQSAASSSSLTSSSAISSSSAATVASSPSSIPSLSSTATSSTSSSTSSSSTSSSTSASSTDNSFAFSLSSSSSSSSSISTATTSSVTTPASSLATSSATFSATSSATSAASSTTSASSITAVSSPQWQWIDVPGTQCGNGSPTGFAVNLYPGSTELLIRFQEGGSCYDYNTCWVQNKAYNMYGFNNASFYSQQQPSKLSGWYPFNRSADSGWQKSNMVWLPYCTGDFFSGDNVVTYSLNGNSRVTYHKGWSNSKLMLGKLNDMLPGMTRVWLTGTSAGGFATPLRYQDAQDAFAGARVDLLADSGETPLSILIRPSQNIQIPDKSRCPNCNDSSFDSYIVGLAQANPASRFASMSYTPDTVIPTNQGVAQSDFNNELLRLWNAENTQTSNARQLVVPLQGHGVLFGGPGQTAADGTVVADWLRDFKTDSPNWSSHS